MSVSILEQSKIQAQVLVPLLKAFQTEIGTERANEIARKALGSWAYKVGQQIKEQGTGTAAEKMAAVLPVFSADDAHDIDVLKQTPDAFEFNVTRCRYAQFYKELGEPELGFLFLCSQDFPITEGLSPDLELVRTQTIMQGASYCDFRWRMKGKSSQS